VINMQSLRHIFRNTPLCSSIRSAAGGEPAVLCRFFSRDADSATGGYGSPTWGSVSATGMSSDTSQTQHHAPLRTIHLCPMLVVCIGMLRGHNMGGCVRNACGPASQPYSAGST
jgi:hypothetical protein